MYKVLRPDTIPPLTKVNVVDCLIFQEILLVVMGELDICPKQATIPTKEYIVGVTVQETEVGLKRSITLPLFMLGRVLMALVEVNLGLRPAILSPVIQVIMVNNLVLIAMLIKKVNIGLTPANSIHISMVN